MLAQFSVKFEKNVMRAAMREGANEIRDEARQQLASNGNVDTGVLARGLKVSTRAKAGKIVASLKAKGKHAFVAHWLEYGTAAHKIASKKGLAFGGYVYRMVDHPGISPKPFFRPALDAKAQAAVVAVARGVKKRLTAAGMNTSGIETE